MSASQRGTDCASWVDGGCDVELEGEDKLLGLHVVAEGLAGDCAEPHVRLRQTESCQPGLLSDVTSLLGSGLLDVEGGGGRWNC